MNFNILNKFENNHLNFNCSHSCNADDIESELAAIPESFQSDSTLLYSSCGSLTEVEESIYNYKGRISTYKFTVPGSFKKENTTLNNNSINVEEHTEKTYYKETEEYNNRQVKIDFL